MTSVCIAAGIVLMIASADRGSMSLYAIGLFLTCAGLAGGN